MKAGLNVMLKRDFFLFPGTVSYYRDSKFYRDLLIYGFAQMKSSVKKKTFEGTV